MHLISIFIIFWNLIAVHCPTDNYCSICSGGSHIMCKYEKGPASTCHNYKQSEINKNAKASIVDIHNQFRSKVAQGLELRGSPGPQPSASNMLMIEWDDELADIAQRFADQCFHQKQQLIDECRLTDRFKYGIMIASIIHNKNVPIDFAYTFNYWYNNVQRFNGSTTGKFEMSFSTSTNSFHYYSQMVWAKTHFIGCGHAAFEEQTQNQEKPHFIHRLVCTYGPTGNIIGASVYLVGEPCSSCPEGFGCSADYPGLCTNSSLGPVVIEDSVINQVEIDFSNVLDTDTPVNKPFPKSWEQNQRKENDSIPEKSDKTAEGNKTNRCNKPPKSPQNIKTYVGVWKRGSCRCDIHFRSNSSKLSSNYAFINFPKLVLTMIYIVFVLYLI